MLAAKLASASRAGELQAGASVNAAAADQHFSWAAGLFGPPGPMVVF